MSAFVFFIDLVARLHLPNKLTINANQTACLELDAHALELLARAFGVAVEHAASVEFVAPGDERHDFYAGRELEARRCRFARVDCAFVQGREREPLAIREFARGRRARLLDVSAGRTTRLLISSPSRSVPSGTRSSRETVSMPSAKSLASSTVTMTSPVLPRSTLSWLSTAPLKLVWPRGRLASIPQW